MTQRTEKIDALLREEIGAIISRELSDPALGFTTVTDVETAPDLSHAQVWISQIGQADDRAASLQALRRALPYIRRLLGQRVRLRRIPELHLRVDDTAERGTRLLKLISELEVGANPDGDPPIVDTLPTPVARISSEADPDLGTAAGEAAAARVKREASGSRKRARGDRPRRGANEHRGRRR